jgi:hypothetical protein
MFAHTVHTPTTSVGIQPDRAHARGDCAARCTAAYEEEGKVASPRDGLRDRWVSASVQADSNLPWLSENS